MNPVEIDEFKLFVWHKNRCDEISAMTEDGPTELMGRMQLDYEYFPIFTKGGRPVGTIKAGKRKGRYDVEYYPYLLSLNQMSMPTQLGPAATWGQAIDMLIAARVTDILSH